MNKMPRLAFLTKSFAAFAILFCLASSSSAATLKIATIAPDGSFWLNEMKKAADAIDKKTEGRVKFKFYGGGTMGNDRSVLRKIRVGQLDGGMFTSGGLSDDCPDLRIYGIPFLFPTVDSVAPVRAQFDPVLAQELEKAGFVSFGFADGGFALFMSNQPVTSLESMKGKKMWVPEGDKLSYEGMEALGLSPVALSLTDVTTGLQTKLLDIVANSPIGAVAFQWHTRVKYITTTPLSYIIATMAIKKSSFDALSEADRKVVRDEMERVYKLFDKKNREDNASAYKALLAAGIQPVTPSEKEVGLWRGQSRKTSERMAGEGFFSRELYDRILALANEPPKAGK
jgi:TRAP-type C4-dicarboxylate transport system substrate-binding protein